MSDLWAVRNIDVVLELLRQHVYLSLIPTVLGLLLALPIGLAVRERPRIRAFVVTGAAIAFTIPSLALLVIIPAIIGTSIIDPVNLIVALTIYSVSLQVRTVLESLDAVSPRVREAATAIGFSGAKRTVLVDLPLTIPVLAAGTRVVAVTNVALVSVGALLGVGALGDLFTRGYQRDYPEQILTGIVLIMLLAAVYDRVIALIGRALTPWTRADRSGGSRRIAKLVEETELGEHEEVVDAR